MLLTNDASDLKKRATQGCWLLLGDNLYTGYQSDFVLSSLFCTGVFPTYCTFFACNVLCIVPSQSLIEWALYLCS